jgi:hypothetical protein
MSRLDDLARDAKAERERAQRRKQERTGSDVGERCGAVKRDRSACERGSDCRCWSHAKGGLR